MAKGALIMMGLNGFCCAAWGLDLYLVLRASPIPASFTAFP